MLDFLLANVSYVGIIVVLILTGAGLPIPEEVAIIAAGIASHSGHLDPWLALASCLIGALVGDCVMYALGYHFGHGMLREHRWFARYLRPERERHIEQMIAQHGPKVFFAARFLVGLRSPVYLTAGILRYPFRKFILIDAICASIVVTLFFGLSYLFADRILSWWQWIHDAELAVSVTVVAAIVGVVLFFYVRHRRRVERIRVRRELRSLRLRVHAPEGANDTNTAA
jgi:membrane protein DedA with SNARE-associated domain